MNFSTAMRWIVSIALFVSTIGTLRSQRAVLAETPPMGWNSWNHFGESINDADVRAAADALVSSGMREAGYTYVNIDGGWQGQRDANGNIQSNSRFPNMKALADYVHSKGLKLGIYSSPGPTDCAGSEGSYGHEQQDANTFAQWTIDYLKYDLCSYSRIMQDESNGDRRKSFAMMQQAYGNMYRAILNTHRVMTYSLCQYGLDAVWEWGPQVGGNLWRTTYDIEPTWQSIYYILTEQAGLAKYAGPGHWNDPDMLEVGNGQQTGPGNRVRYLTAAENRMHFSMWAMLAAPLLAGNDLSNMTPEVRDILTNRDVIAIDQDRLGREGLRAYSEGEVDVWTRHLSGGAMAIAVINAGSDRSSSHLFHLSLSKLGLHGPQRGKDLWAGGEIVLTENMALKIASHGVLLVRIPAPK